MPPESPQELRHSGGYVVDAGEVEAERADSDTAAIATTIDGSVGCDNLVQRVITFSQGRSADRRSADAEEILYVLEGAGTLRVDDEEHALAPDTAAYVAPGETYSVETDELLRLVSVLVPDPPPPGDDLGTRRVTVGLAEQESHEATTDREFFYLVHPEVGCRGATQFVGWIPPSRAPDHYHHYDEVVYVLDGEGAVHIGESSTPIRRGSCIHLPNHLVHCLENRSRQPMPVLGVFRPAGDPSAAFLAD